MLSEFNNHFILISGESGSGKTEASKKILQFYAVSCPSTRLLNNVGDRLLLSNPVLEVSGTLIYLLEKSRVVHQNHGERNFHIFYQLVEGGEEDLLRWLGLERNCKNYRYLVQVVTQFKSSLVGLTEILMSKEPWYVRCIKPNEAKQP
ncbi:hypothetical protein GOODEAATRI_021772, partial [Goodea atripinnis]